MVYNYLVDTAMDSDRMFHRLETTILNLKGAKSTQTIQEEDNLIYYPSMSSWMVRTELPRNPDSNSTTTNGHILRQRDSNT